MKRARTGKSRPVAPKATARSISSVIAKRAPIQVPTHIVVRELEALSIVRLSTHDVA
jgi:hypothetical protein